MAEQRLSNTSFNLRSITRGSSDLSPKRKIRMSLHSNPTKEATLTPSSNLHPLHSIRTQAYNLSQLHLATCTQNHPHVSLMNYTYLAPNTRPSPTQHSQLPPGPTIIMTSNPSSKKTLNLLQNPTVSLLVHDWVSSRPPTTTTSTSSAAGAAAARDSSPPGARASSLASMLMQLNSAAVSSISATLNGEAHVLAPGSEEERWCKEQHLANNTFSSQEDFVSSRQGHAFGRRVMDQQRSLSLGPEDALGVGVGEGDGGGAGIFGSSPSDGRAGDGGRGRYIEDEDVRVVVVRIRDGRISDWKGGVKDWAISEEGGEGVEVVDGVEGRMNGVS